MWQPSPAFPRRGFFNISLFIIQFYKTSKMIKTKKAPVVNGTFQYRKLAQHILDKRNNENLTFREMSDATGVSQGSCHRAESIASGLDVDTVIAICNWLGKPVQFFIEPVKPKANVKKDKN